MNSTRNFMPILKDRSFSLSCRFHGFYRTRLLSGFGTVSPLSLFKTERPYILRTPYTMSSPYYPSQQNISQNLQHTYTHTVTHHNRVFFYTKSCPFINRTGHLHYTNNVYVKNLFLVVLHTLSSNEDIIFVKIERFC